MDIWKVKYVRIGDLIPNAKNPRKISKEKLERLQDKIQRLGFHNPVKTDENLNVLGGNQRLKALLKIAGKDLEIPVMYPTRPLTQEEKDEIIITDNISDGEWDWDILTADWDKVLTTSWGLDWGEVETAAEEDNQITEDEVPEKIETRCKHGDIWQLGNHRLMCGDSTSITDVEKLMDGAKVDMVFTDPPYNMSNNFDTSTINLKKMQKRVDDIVNFNPDEIAYLTQLNICSFYIFTSKNLIPRYFEIFKDFDFNILVWCKDNPTPLTNYTFLPDVEYLLYFSKKGKIWNNGLDTTIYKKYYNGNKLEGRKEAGDVHPTVKPQKIIQDKIQISSSINGVVLDVFGGSGSTLIACEQLKRNCFMMELDEHYCDVIIQRWENLTGEKAVLINN